MLALGGRWLGPHDEGRSPKLSVLLPETLVAHDFAVVATLESIAFLACEQRHVSERRSIHGREAFSMLLELTRRKQHFWVLIEFGKSTHCQDIPLNLIHIHEGIFHRSGSERVKVPDQACRLHVPFL